MELTMEPSQSDQTSISEAVVTAVADAEGVEPEALTPRLYDVIDPDALDTLVESADHDTMSLSFPYGDWTVHIEGSEVTVSAESQQVVAGEEPSSFA